MKITVFPLLQEGGPFPGPETGLLSNTRRWIVWGDTCADKARDFTGKGHPGGEQEGKGTQEDCSAAWLAVSGLRVMGLVSELTLVNHSDSKSFLVVHALFSQDGCQREGFWEVVGHVVSHFDLSRTLPVGGGLLVPCSYNSCRSNGQGEQCAPPNSSFNVPTLWVRSPLPAATVDS